MSARAPTYIAGSDTPVVPERGMRWLLGALIVFVAVSDIFDLPMSLAPGLSAKNALLYVLFAALFFKIVVMRRFVLELKPVAVCFALLIGYSFASLLVAAFVVQYPRYDVIQSGINLKSRMVDQAIFFLVFFYGLRETRNALTTLKLVLLAVILANLTAALDAWGIVNIGELEERTDGRMQGVMGESNQYAAFVTSFLPALAAAVFMSRGVWRLFWVAGLLVSTGAMIMAVSRGAFVAIIVSALWSAWMFRRYVSLRSVMRIGAVVVAVAVAAFGVISIRYGSLIYSRVFGDSASADIADASSGRTEIWSNALATMAEYPLTFLSGFGWEVYWTMPFRYSPHNHYLSLWFNLGLVGLICGTLLLVLVAREARATVAIAPPAYRPYLISFVIGTLAIAVAIFFVDLYVPWLWFWAYAGLTMRIAVNIRKEARLSQARPQQEAVVERPRADPYGWSAAGHHAR